MPVIPSQALSRNESQREELNKLVTRPWPGRSSLITICLVVMAGYMLVPSWMYGQPHVQGSWTTLSASMPINPAHLAVLKNGKVLIVAGLGAGASSTPQAALYDPSTQTVSSPQTIGWDMFCNETVVMVDGRPYIVGGFGYTRTAVYDSATGAFTELAQTSKAHWYPSTMLTTNGSVLALGGIDSSGNTSLPVELFNGSSWTTAYGPAVWTPPLYPRGHVLGNGKIFYSGWETTSTIVDENTGQETLNVATTNYGAQRVYG